MQAAVKICEKSGFVQRARVDLGTIELLKFSLSLMESNEKAGS